MSRKQWWLIAVLVIVAAVLGGMASSGISLLVQAQAQRNSVTSKQPARRWEYQVYIAPSPKDLADQANKLGDEGWEMMDVITDERVVSRYIGYFRRPKQ
jgi:hypothetical protein